MLTQWWTFITLNQTLKRLLMRMIIHFGEILTFTFHTILQFLKFRFSTYNAYNESYNSNNYPYTRIKTFSSQTYFGFRRDFIYFLNSTNCFLDFSSFGIFFYYVILFFYLFRTNHEYRLRDFFLMTTNISIYENCICKFDFILYV